MTACCLALALLISPAPPDWHEGLAVRYSEGIMEKVARNRGITPAPCMVAYTHARDTDMGVRWLEVEGTRTGVRKRCLTVDLPRPGRDKANLIRRGVIIELDYASSLDLCGPSWSGKATECPVRVRAVSGVATCFTAHGGVVGIGRWGGMVSPCAPGALPGRTSELLTTGRPLSTTPPYDVKPRMKGVWDGY